MMQLTYGDVLGSIDALSQLLELKPAPVLGIAVKIARNARKLEAVAQDFAKARDAVVASFRADFTETWVDEDGEEQTGIPEKRQAAFEAAWMAEVNVLLPQAVDVDVRVVPIEDLEKCEEKKPGFEVPTLILFKLWFMFGLEEPEPQSVESPIAEAA